MTKRKRTLVPQNNSVKSPSSKLFYFEGDFYSKDQIRELAATRKRLSRKRVPQRKRKPILMFGLNTTKA